MAGERDITGTKFGDVAWLDIMPTLLAGGRRGERVIEIIALGRAAYDPVWRLQHELVRRRKSGTIGDVLILVEHEPVITLGRSGDDSNIVASADQLQHLGVEVRRVERGGDVTYHGPGQLVGYPILDLHEHQKDVRWYVRSLEEVLIRTLADFGIVAYRDPENVGVWVDDKKIAAIGARIEEWVTYHGFALNVDPDLSHFDLIVPCGMPDRSATSMARVAAEPPSMAEVRASVERRFASVFEIAARAAGRSGPNRLRRHSAEVSVSQEVA